MITTQVKVESFQSVPSDTIYVRTSFYPVYKLQDISLQIPAKSMKAIISQLSAGKSVLVDMNNGSILAI